MIRYLFLFALVGCGPYLYARTAPPPGRTAAFDEDDGKYYLSVSQGVAIAINCVDGGPCKNVVVSTENESIADVKGAASGSMEYAPYSSVGAVPSTVVIIGKNPGKTIVKVKTSDGSKTIIVTVVPPPATGQPAVVAN